MSQPAGQGDQRFRAAAWGGGGLAGALAAVVGVMIAQGRAAKREIGPQRVVPPYQDGRYGSARGRSIHLAVLGDSVAAGLGADSAADTVGVVLAKGMVAATGRPVILINHAVVGARSAGLEKQVDRTLSARPHVAVVLIGANDVTHMVPRRRAAADLARQLDRLVAAGCGVVVGTCPDLGTIRPVGPPLRWYARTSSRQLARAQRQAAAAAGVRSVDLYHLLGPEFTANAETLFGADRFHPSSLGYRRLGATLLPPALAALGDVLGRGRLALHAEPWTQDEAIPPNLEVLADPEA